MFEDYREAQRLVTLDWFDLWGRWLDYLEFQHAAARAFFGDLPKAR